MGIDRTSGLRADEIQISIRSIRSSKLPLERHHTPTNRAEVCNLARGRSVPFSRPRQAFWGLNGRRQGAARHCSSHTPKRLCCPFTGGSLAGIVFVFANIKNVGVCSGCVEADARNWERMTGVGDSLLRTSAIFRPRFSVKGKAMQRCSKRLRAGFALSLILIFAVTFWGLHDKVSLYQSTAHGMPTAQAKLLSGRELVIDTANQVQAVISPNLPTPTIPFLAFALLLTLPAAARARREFSHIPSPPSRPAARFRALDRRPPPCI